MKGSWRCLSVVLDAVLVLGALIQIVSGRLFHPVRCVASGGACFYRSPSSRKRG